MHRSTCLKPFPNHVFLSLQANVNSILSYERQAEVQLYYCGVIISYLNFYIKEWKRNRLFTSTSHTNATVCTIESREIHLCKTGSSITSMELISKRCWLEEVIGKIVFFYLFFNTDLLPGFYLYTRILFSSIDIFKIYG